MPKPRRRRFAGFPKKRRAKDSSPALSSAFSHVAENVWAASPELAYVQLAAHMPLVGLIELAFELCGTYAVTGIAFDSPCDSPYNIPPLATVSSLRRFAQRNSSLRGSRKALQALRYAADNAASPREAKLALLLGLPTRYGGYGLGIPEMNRELHTTPAAYALSGRRTLRCDLCWNEAKLDVEHQSSEWHESEASRIGDSRRANALELMGYRSIGITSNELDSLSATDAIAQMLRDKLGKRSRTKYDPARYRAQRIALRRQLGLPIEPYLR